ncbi:hypothetical protein [Salmonella enterica]|uniref:hypothetical protein n=1 Tax=Salmonella enterica TaxID=28901 RepID=UPI003CB28757
MESVALSRTTRWGMLLTGLLQGVLCYLLMAWLVPQNSDWLFYGMPATIALSSMLLLTVVSFKQRALWGWLGLTFVVVLAMSGWLKWQVEAVEKWRLAELLWLYGLRLVLMAMLVLPWMQYQLHSQTGSARYPQFYLRLWHNVLTLFIVLVANGLFWLVLLLWSALFRLVGIRFFSTLFFETEAFIYVTIGLITALAVILARTQSRLVAAVQKLLTLIATGLLPVVSLLALLFIVTLPFTGLEAISARVSAAGLLSTLTLMLLLLVAIVKEQSYSDDSCLEADACVLVSQDLNGDGQPEQVLYNFIVAESQVYGLKEGKWTQKAFARLPDGFSKTQLLHAIAGHRLDSAPKAWRDIIVDGQRLDVDYYNE